MKKLLFTSAVVAMSMSATGQNAPQLTNNNINEVIAAMTVEEKAHLCIGTEMSDAEVGNAVVGVTRKFVPGAAGTTYPIPRLGIPAVVLADGPAGLRIDPVRDFDSKTYYCTHFPIATALASSWNTELVQNVGKAMGNEVLEYGVDVYLAPAVNIHRNPLCGRNFEYYSEDPLVSGDIAAAFINGVQGNGVGTSIKHFAVNNQETNRTGNDSRLSQRALREIYLKGFQKAITLSSPWTVMSSYNFINGTYASESKELLTTILRDEWGYKGMVMTDWFGGSNAVAQMEAGNDMLQPGTNKQFKQIVAAIADSSLQESVLDRNVKRILEMIVKTPRFNGYKYTNTPDLKAHAAIARQSAIESMVLLENDAALPISNTIKNIGVYGCSSYNMIAGGTGSGNVNRAYTVSLIEGLRNVGFVINEELLQRYKKHIDAENAKNEESNKKLPWYMAAPLPPEILPTASDLKKEVAANDMGLITLGRISGEFIDRKLDADFNLSAEESALIEQVCAAYHAAGKKVVVILNIGGVVETASWKSKPDAILLAWQVGQEGGNSIAEVLSGKANPSGKLTMTFPVHFKDAASSDNFPSDGRVVKFSSDNRVKKQNPEKNIDYTNYAEDIYVGYRYFDSFEKEVSYPFGYGLSYTVFEYNNPVVECDGDSYTVKVDVTNKGDRAGKEVVEVYVTAPKSKLNKPAKELRAFAKTHELKAGETQTVMMQIQTADLASFDEKASAWVTSAGKYRFSIGTSSRDIRATVETKLTKAAVTKTYSVIGLKEKMQLLK